MFFFIGCAFRSLARSGFRSLGALGGFLGRSWALLGVSCALLGALVRFGALLGASWSILGWIFGRPGVIW